MNILKYITLFCLAALPTISQAVTEQEMEQARTIAAKAYIRYANDGSGYLDDINPKTMAELEAALKPKEKENIQAFKAIAVPSDYKSWDKAKLVEYWGVTAFLDKGLQEKGRGGRIRAKSLINKLNISAPSAGASEPAAASPAATAAGGDLAANQKAELDSLKADEQAILEEAYPAEEEVNIDKAENYTWVYIMVLSILVAIVLGLVVYAASVFKKKENGPEARARAYDEEETERYETMISDKDVEIAMLKKKLESASRQNSELKSKIDALTAEVAALKSTPVPTPEILAEPLPPSTPKERKPEPASQPTKSPLRSIYLGRANAQGIFVRADRTLNVGHSVFVLTTSDGFSGTFKVADSPAAWSLALSNPAEYLENACTGNDLEDTRDVNSIITESSGTAVFEGGRWKVIRKARIRYMES